MSIWSFVIAHPDDVISGLTFIAGLIGASHVIKKRAATKAEVDRWASTAAGFVVVLVKQGVITDHDAVVKSGLERFRALASAAGIDVNAEHEIRALALITEALTVAGQMSATVAGAEMVKAADAALAHMAKLDADLKKPSSYIAPTTVTRVQ